MSRRLRDAAGQTFVEWLAVMAAVVALVGLVTVAEPARAIVAQASRLVCQVGGGACAVGGARGRSAAAHPRVHALSARAATATRPPPPSPDAHPPRNDPDNDGLTNREERRLGTNPRRADSDGDGLNDGEEVKVDHTDPIFRDTDHDGISDRDEVRSDGRLNPRKGDTDGDGLRDAEELAAGLNPDDADSDGAYGDLGDGLTDGEELRLGTDPTRYDTDGDGYPDGWEVDHGRDPRHDERNPIQKIFDDVLDNPFDYLIPGGLVRGVARGTLERAIRKIAPKLKDIRAVKTVREALALRRARIQAVQRLTRNKATGDAARDRIAATFPDSHVEVSLDTPLGVRRIDVLTADGEAIESKVGRTGATKAIRGQVAKDVALRRLQPQRVRELVWHFSRSPATGRMGPTPALERLLRENDIRIVYDP
jgi:hypothetical protein